MPLNRKVRLYHVSSQLSRYAPRSWRFPVLVTVHDLNYLHMDQPPEQLIGMERRTVKAIANASHIVAISDFVRQDILSHFDIDPSRITRIYNGVSHYNGPLRRPDHLPDGDFLLYLGRVTESKNIHVLPSLLKGNDFNLVLAGPVDKKDMERERFLAEARRHGVLDRVFFTGSVGEEEKNWLLSHCSAFLFPSLCEGFGLPVFEAMQYYKPVFLSDRTALPEVGGDCAFYFNHEFDPEGMRLGFEKGMSAFAEGSISREAVDAHLARFSWGGAAQEYYNLYERLI